ncbi:MAG: hypothetical protein AAF351_04965 [Pseudomonadota bacterium]
MHQLSRWSLLSLLILCNSGIADNSQGSPQLAEWFERGTDLISPYAIYIDAPPADASTATAVNELEEGIDLLSKVVDAQPENWAAYWFIGKAYQALKQHQASVNAFRESYAIHRENPDVGRELVIELVCIGDTEGAVVVAAELVSDHPYAADLIANLGFAYLTNDQLDEASDAIDDSLRLAPRDPITRNMRNEINAVRNGKPPAQYCPY